MKSPMGLWPAVPGIWSTNHVAAIADRPWLAAPVFTAADCAPVVPNRWLWDLWPVQTPSGAIAVVAGREYWMALSAPVTDNPNDRHFTARLWLLQREGDEWHDLGPVLPDSLSPGSREWSGSAVLNGDRLILHFTAAGRRAEPVLTYEQRLFMTQARLSGASSPVSAVWTDPVETLRSDGIIYERAQEATGAAGTIKAFRDPAWFRDPASGAEYLLFTASLAASTSAFNGAIGIASRQGEDWEILPPLVSADTINNELERPHIVVSGGRYYLFWSTQACVFAPGIAAPTGLYGMAADRLQGPWTPINETGLVIANPAAAPHQAYSWLVLADLRVASFADRCPDFVGQPAPMLQLRLSGNQAALERIVSSRDVPQDRNSTSQCES